MSGECFFIKEGAEGISCNVEHNNCPDSQGCEAKYKILQRISADKQLSPQAVVGGIINAAKEIEPSVHPRITGEYAGNASKVDTHIPDGNVHKALFTLKTEREHFRDSAKFILEIMINSKV